MGVDHSPGELFEHAAIASPLEVVAIVWILLWVFSGSRALNGPPLKNTWFCHGTGNSPNTLNTKGFGFMNPFFSWLLREQICGSPTRAPGGFPLELPHEVEGLDDQSRGTSLTKMPSPDSIRSAKLNRTFPRFRGCAPRRSLRAKEIPPEND